MDEVASALSASDGECCTVTQKVQEASHSVSDSDDEQIPDPAIPPAFSTTELAMVQACYKKLHSAFRSAVAYRFTNAAGVDLIEPEPAKMHTPSLSAIA